MLARYSKRDIGRRFQEVDVQAVTHEYGGLQIVENEDGYMALRRESAHGRAQPRNGDCSDA